jgi:hypothetical protein
MDDGRRNASATEDLIHLELLVGHRVQEHALAAKALDLLHCRRRERVGLDSETLGRQLDGFPVLISAPDDLFRRCVKPSSAKSPSSSLFSPL